jgi:nucleoside-diphosphate-sugar epimerase
VLSLSAAKMCTSPTGFSTSNADGEMDPASITENSPLRTKLYPYRGKMLRAEDDPQSWLDHYDKIPAERVVLAHPGLSSTILRLPPVYGSARFPAPHVSLSQRMLDGREAMLIDEREARWRWTHGYVENVADAITLAVIDSRGSGRIYNVGEPFALSRAEHIRQIAQAANWPGRIVTLPSERAPEKLRWKAIAAASAMNSAIASVSIWPKPSGAPLPGNATTSQKRSIPSGLAMQQRTRHFFNELARYP